MPDQDQLDPTLQQLVEELRRPVDLGTGIDARVMAQLRADSRFGRPLGRRLVWLAGVAAATITIDAPWARSITLVGDFNDWDPRGTPLERRRDGHWVVELMLKPGRYRYGYLADGKTWLADPGRVAIPDRDFEEPTSLLTVQE
jgi:1,4-alpha-glucan branching enzyme